MNIRSKPLYNYLLESGVLNGTTEEIARAKQCYRKQYKKQWKAQQRPRKEIRIEFKVKEFVAIKANAHQHNMTHTVYSRNAILSACTLPYDIPRKDEVLKILQLIGMAINTLRKDTLGLRKSIELLEQAETMLLHYIKQEQQK